MLKAFELEVIAVLLVHHGDRDQPFDVELFDRGRGEIDELASRDEPVGLIFALKPDAVTGAVDARELEEGLLGDGRRAPVLTLALNLETEGPVVAKQILQISYSVRDDRFSLDHPYKKVLRCLHVVRCCPLADLHGRDPAQPSPLKPDPIVPCNLVQHTLRVDYECSVLATDL